LPTALAALALLAGGCSKSRPTNVATAPGDSYVELSDLAVTQDGSDIKLKVHYRFPESLPHPDAWFVCTFEVHGGRGGTVTVRRRGRDLGGEGDFEGATNAAFLMRAGGVFTAKVQQGKAQGGPYHDVSEKIAAEF
jgi:hypothetical protein